MSSRSTKIQAISPAKPSVSAVSLSSPQNPFCTAQTPRRLHKPKPHSSILLLKNSNRTLNTSNKRLTCTKHAGWQFLIGTENALFGVLCRPERSRGISQCGTGWQLTCPEERRATHHWSLPSAWRAVAFGEGGLIEFLWEIRTSCKSLKKHNRGHF